MSQSSTATLVPPRQQSATTVVDDEETVQDVLAALDDDACRSILDATSDDALSATELSETCDLPLSTTYRKLDRLTDAGLLDERVRVRRSGRHTSEYARLVEDVVVTLAPSGSLELEITRRTAAGPAGF